MPHLAKVRNLAAEQVLQYQINIMLVDPSRGCAAVEDFETEQLEIIRLTRCDLDHPARHTIVIGKHAVHRPGDQSRGLIAVERPKDIRYGTTQQTSMPAQ
jgi:hypothetical protein